MPTPGTADAVSVCGPRTFLGSEFSVQCLSQEEVIQFYALCSGAPLLLPSGGNTSCKSPFLSLFGGGADIRHVQI